MDRRNNWLIIKSTGGAGLGDLLRTVLSGIYYARLTGRTIYVDWNDGMFGREGENVFPFLFRLEGVRWSDEPPREPPLSVWPTAWKGRLDLPLGSVYAKLRQDDWNRAWALRNLSFDQARFSYDADALVMWDFDGFEASWRAGDPQHRYGSTPEEALCELAERHLRLPEALRDAVDAFRTQRFRRTMIGVHVRKTFEKGGPGKQVQDQQYWKSLDAVRTRHPNAGIFLATDNARVLEDFRKRYGDVVTRNKWFPEPGKAIHFSDERPDRMGSARDAIIEMFLLASCDCLVYPALSSFSRMARYISGLPGEHVFPLTNKSSFKSRWTSVRRLGSRVHGKVLGQ